MGYDLHITRKDFWCDETGSEISLAEWRTYINSDPSMRLDGFAEIDVGEGMQLRQEGEGIAVWTEYSGHNVHGNMAWFGYFRGDIAVKNPDQEIRQKMWTIAQRLGAKVQGDDGEYYGSDGEMTET